MDKDQLLGIDQEEIEEDIESEFFSLLADRINEEQAKEIKNFNIENNETQLEQYIVNQIPHYHSFIKDAVHNVIKFYQEDYKEAIKEKAIKENISL